MNISIRKAVVLIVTWIVANNGGLAQASPQLQGGVTATDYPPLDPRNFPNEDPRKVEPRQLPAVIGGGQPPRCTPPDKSWRLLAEDKNQCLYAAPFSPVKLSVYQD